MDWKEIQTQWKEGASTGQGEFTIPTQRKLKSLEQEMKFFYQDYGKSPSLVSSFIFLALAGGMLFLLIRDGFSAFGLGHMIFVFLPLAISNLVRGLLIKRVSQEDNLLQYLKSAHKDVKWIMLQNYGLIITFCILFPVGMSLNMGMGIIQEEGFDYRVFVILIPFLIILGALFMWYRNHHTYNVFKLNRVIAGLIKDLEDEG